MAGAARALAPAGKALSIFGPARATARWLAEAGFAVITGGGVACWR